MTLTERDRKIALAAAPVLVVLVYWFVLLGPKREEASLAGETLASEQLRLTEAESQAATLSAAKKNFAADYAAVVRLGKAVPTSVDMPSLLVQLDQAAKGTGIVFEKVAAGERGPLSESASPAAAAVPAAPAPGQPTTPAAPAPGQPAPAAGAPAPTAPSGQPAQSAPGAAAGSAQGAVDTANTAGASPAADPAAAGAAPTAAAPAPSPLETVPLEFSFKGSFFELANLFHRLKRFVYVKGDDVRVRGRLMTIDSVQYETDPATFPALTAKVTASVFLTPKAEGVAAGATPSGPAPSAAAPAGQTSTANSGAPAPAPAATATP